MSPARWNLSWARSAATILFVFLVVAVARAEAASYPPAFHFRTITTERASVHFHEGEEAMARRAAALATEILAHYQARYAQKVPRVQIVLVDADDDPNAFATLLPYPTVTVRAVAPNGNDTFGIHEGWLRLALVHELAHIVHLEAAHGLWGFGRHVFGRAPFLFPNVFAMTWMIEGLATYEETQLTAFGRGRDPDARMVLRAAALDGRFPKEDQAIYALDAWPSGLVPYLFGEAFLRDLSERSGEDTLPRLDRQHATQLPPYLDGRTVRKVTGTGLHAQWKRWTEEVKEASRREAAARAERGLTAATPITKRGIRQVEPRFSPDGSWIAYTSQTLERFPEIRLVGGDGSGDRRLALRNGGSGLGWTPDGRHLVYAELQVHGTYSVFNDLSLVEVPSGRVRRLTRGLRAYDPDVSPDGGRIVFARKLGDRSDLFTVGIDGRDLQRITSSPAAVEWSAPRFSPDGRSIAASRLVPGGWLDVVLVDPLTGAVEHLTHDRAKDVEPTWTPDGRAVVFRSDRDGVSNLHAVRLADRALLRVTNVLGGAFHPSISPDGRFVAFARYSSPGYDVAVAPFDLEAAVVADAFTDLHPAPRADPPPAEAPTEPYRPWSTLWPRYWSPWIESSDDETRIGVVTGGSDALSRHVWLLRSTYGVESERVNASGYYFYNRFRPTLLVAGQDTARPSQGGTIRTREMSVQASVPLRRTIRSLQWLSLGYLRRVEESPNDRVSEGGIESAWTFSSARSYPFSISPSDGCQLRLAWLHEAESLGGERSLDKLTAEARHYLRLFGARDVLAVHLAAGTTLGAADFEDSFAVGGYSDGNVVEQTNHAVLRGFDQNQFTGRRHAAANLEYRFPLFSPQRGWRSVPVFLRHFRGTLFFDAAHAWSQEFRVEDVKTAAGASLGLDTALGFTLPATAEATIARGLGSNGDTKLYLRFGLAF